MAYYDYDEDRALIKGAFCASFGMLPQDFEELTYADYIDLFPSINAETTFTHILHIRMETDHKRIKEFSSSEYAEWLKWQERKKKFEERQALRKKQIQQDFEKQKEKDLAIARQRLAELAR